MPIETGSPTDVILNAIAVTFDRETALKVQAVFENKRTKDYDGTKCPACNHFRTDYSQHPRHGEGSKKGCGACGATWTEELEVTGYNKLKLRQ